MKNKRSQIWSVPVIAFCILIASTAHARRAPQIIPLKIVAGGLQTIEATIDGQQGTFLFDSGWGVSAVTPAMAKRINCRPWGRITGFRAIGERSDAQQCEPAKINIGEFSVLLPTVMLADMQQFMPPQSPDYAGAIGLDAFAGKTVTLRSRANRIVIETPGSARSRTARAMAIPIRLVREAQGASLTVFAGVPTAAGILWMELDTGNMGPTMIGKHAAALVGLKPDQAHGQTLTMPFVPGAIVTGPVQVLDIIIDGNIGHDFLYDWDLTLDLAAGKGWISPATK